VCPGSSRISEIRWLNRCKTMIIEVRTIRTMALGSNCWDACNSKSSKQHGNPDDLKIAYDGIGVLVG
jgi:hypothetical protein